MYMRKLRKFRPVQAMITAIALTVLLCTAAVADVASTISGYVEDPNYVSSAAPVVTSTISGLVTFADGAAAGGFTVFIAKGPNGIAKFNTTDESGRYTLPLYDNESGKYKMSIIPGNPRCYQYSPAVPYMITINVGDNLDAVDFKAFKCVSMETIPLNQPTDLNAVPVTLDKIELTWTTDPDESVTRYRIYRDGAFYAMIIKSATTPMIWYDKGLLSTRTYCYIVTATDDAGNESPKSSESCAVPQADTAPPSVPTGLTATAVSSSRISLSWSGSTDAGVGVAGYNIYRNRVGDPSPYKYVSGQRTTSWDNTDLAPSSPYCYTVAAVDAGDYVSARSSEVCATTQADATPPSVPSGFTATPASSSQINLSWSVSTDTGVGVKGYNIYKRGTLLKSVTGTSTSDSGLGASTNYCYKVTAVDLLDNESAMSIQACATTQADTTPPSVPTGLTATAAGSSQINLTWSASTDTSGVKGYKLYRGGDLLKSVTGTSMSDIRLSPLTNYCYTVSAVDAEGNESAQSSQSCATTQADTTPPSAPTGLTARAASSSQIDLSWAKSLDTGGTGLNGYKLYRGGALLRSVFGTSTSDTRLSPSTSYCYTVSAVDDAGNESAQSGQSCTTTQADTTPPSVPTGLTAKAASSSQIDLSWSVSTDTGGSGLSGYKIYRGAAFIKNATSTSTSDTGLSPSSYYCYTVSAIDTAGNESARSIQACATTQAPGDTTPPTVPLRVTATAAGTSSINLSWVASTDTGGIAGYKMYRAGTFIKNVTGTSTSDTGLSASTQYCYTVSAVDTAGNQSAQSSPPSCATTGSGGGFCGDITNPCNVPVNKGSNDYKDSIGPGTSKYYKFTVPTGPNANVMVSSQDQIAICQVLVEEGTTANMDTYYENAKEWYEEDPSRYSAQHNVNYPPWTWARFKKSSEGQVVNITANPGTTYYVVVHNDNSDPRYPAGKATYWISVTTPQ